MRIEKNGLTMLFFWRGAVRMKRNGQDYHSGQRAGGADSPNTDPGTLKIDGTSGKRRGNLRVILLVLGLDGGDSEVGTFTLRHGGHGMQIVCHGNDRKKQKRQNDRGEITAAVGRASMTMGAATTDSETR